MHMRNKLIFFIFFYHTRKKIFYFVFYGLTDFFGFSNMKAINRKNKDTDYLAEGVLPQASSFTYCCWWGLYPVQRI
jgi:hypothetical protein